LWEDPFAAVEKALEAQNQINVQVFADGKKVELVTTTVAQQPQGDDGLKSLYRRIGETDSKSILALVVMTQGGSSIENSEARIRDRYAVGAALEVGCFSPDKGESLSYFTWKFPPDAGEHSQSHYTPYEWYSRNPIGTCPTPSEPSDSFRQVLVLWVKTQEGEDRILARISELVSKFPRTSAKLVGPRTSSEFRNILKEIEKRNPKEEYSWQSTVWLSHWGVQMLKRDPKEYAEQKPGKRLQVYSPWATAMPMLLLQELKDVKNENEQPCQSYAECEKALKGLLERAGLDLSYRVTSDEVLFKSLLEELERRQVAVGQDKIVLIGEWDSFYARALPFTFTAAIHQHLQTSPRARRRLAGAASRSGELSQIEKECMSVDVEKIRPPLAGSQCARAFNIKQYSYLNGLDGEASEDQAKRSKSRKEEKSKDKTEDKDRFRDIESYERPEGPSQLDYVRRLVARIKAEQSTAVKAIGILGQDAYDALLILQAVREQFPNVLFFTTDLDARYFHEDELKWTRNLIVASQFGLQLEPSLQQTIPPFRHSLQTSTFFAVLRAIDRVRLQPFEKVPGFIISGQRIEDVYATEIPPRLFEIGRHGAVDLSVEDSNAILKSIHPMRVDVDKDQKSLKLPPRIGLLWIVGLLLSFLALWGYGRLWNWLTAWNEPDLTKHPLLWSLRRAWVFIPVIGALWFMCQIVHLPTYAEEEPFSWSDGVSIWPTEALRFMAISLCLFCLLKARADSGRNIDELTQSFFSDVACQPKDGGWRNALKGFWSDLGWMFHGSKQDHPGEASALWMRYCRAHSYIPRMGRIAVELVVYVGLIVPLWLFMNDGEWRLFVPCRGPFSCFADKVFISLSSLSFLVLNVAVLDAVILTTRWLQEMPAGTRLTEMQQIRLIVERTKIVNRRILYPFLALFLLIAARSHYFDNWDFPPVLILVLTVNSLVALASASMLYLAAVQAKRRILAPLQQRLDQLAQSARDAVPATGEDSSAEGLRQVIIDIDGVQQGAFLPFYQQPLVRATLVALLAFLQYWYLGQ
jgi:hypothetical protein